MSKVFLPILQFPLGKQNEVIGAFDLDLFCSIFLMGTIWPAIRIGIGLIIASFVAEKMHEHSRKTTPTARVFGSTCPDRVGFARCEAREAVNKTLIHDSRLLA